MKTCSFLNRAIAAIPASEKKQAETAFAISDRIANLMRLKGITKSDIKKGLDATDEQVTLWLGGTRTFSLNDIMRLSDFFGEPIITVAT